MCVFIFSTFVWNISHCKKYSARYCHKCTNVFMLSTRYSCQILIKLKFSWQIFKKSSNIKFHGSQLFHADRQTDRHDEANSRFSQFCERAEKRETCWSFEQLSASLLYTASYSYCQKMHVISTILTTLFQRAFIDALKRVSSWTRSALTESTNPSTAALPPTNGRRRPLCSAQSRDRRAPFSRRHQLFHSDWRRPPLCRSQFLF